MADELREDAIRRHLDFREEMERLKKAANLPKLSSEEEWEVHKRRARASGRLRDGDATVPRSDLEHLFIKIDGISNDAYLVEKVFEHFQDALRHDLYHLMERITELAGATGNAWGGEPHSRTRLTYADEEDGR
jgi:translation initiation factor 2 beta subunit (eIF-2beta)/eIF-5